MLAQFPVGIFRRAAKGTRVPLLVIHVAICTGVAVACYAMPCICDALLRLVAGLVVIFGRDKRSIRALSVLQALPRPGRQRLWPGRGRTTSRG